MIEMALKVVMHTSNPICEYAFSWTVDNFSRTSLEVRGPPFSPIPGYPEKFCFELKLRIVTEKVEIERDDWSCIDTIIEHTSYLDVNLIYLNARDIPLQLLSNLAVSNENERLFDGENRERSVKETNILVSYKEDLPSNGIDYALSVMGLKDCKLKIEGTLQFSGYGMTSSIYPLSFKKSLENCRELSNDLKTMYENGLGSDVTFSVGGEKLRAHKAILLGRSPVFAKMFEHDMLENNTNNVTIEDIDSHIFKCFLMFLYTGVVEDNNYDTVISLYSVAEKYQVKSLQKACSVLLVNPLSVESICSVLMVADLHTDKELKNIAKSFICENFFDIVGTTKWVEILSTKPTLADEVLNYMKSLHK